MSSSWSRRSVLRLLGTTTSVGIAGCAGDDETFPTVSLDPNPPPEAAPANVEFSLLNQYSRNDPARIRIRFTSRADARREFDFGAVAPYTYPYGEQSGDGPFLVLVPTSDNPYYQAGLSNGTNESFQMHDDESVLVPDSSRDGCWSSRGQLDAAPVSNPRTLDPDETVEETYALLSLPADERPHDECLAPGRYTFRDENPFETDGFGYGFDVVLED